MPVFRPLIGTDKMEILGTARKIGTYDISSEPFHDCCPVFMPRAPALSASPEQLMQAEGGLDVGALVAQGLRAATLRNSATGRRMWKLPSRRRSSKTEQRRQ